MLRWQLGSEEENEPSSSRREAWARSSELVKGASAMKGASEVGPARVRKCSVGEGNGATIGSCSGGRQPLEEAPEVDELELGRRREGCLVATREKRRG